jgi:hypothetical protein
LVLSVDGSSVQLIGVSGVRTPIDQRADQLNELQLK